jgi:hypothetical protein
MKRLALLCLILTACGSGGDGEADGNAAAPVQGSSPGGAVTTLTGLYEGGQASPRNQLCLVENSPTDTRFGLVVWGDAQHSCSGSGTVERQGDDLRLRMTGDESCVIEARIEGNSVVLPENLPQGCAYYCGARARMTGVRFTQAGTGRDEAIKAKDLVGDPLC